MDNRALLNELPQVNISDFDNYPPTNPPTQSQALPSKKRSRAAANINNETAAQRTSYKKLRTSYLEEYGF